MKKLLVLALFAGSIFASGKISYKPGILLKSGEMSHQLGFGMYEKLVGPLAYNGWTGVGLLPRGHGEHILYGVSSHDAEIWLGDVGFSAGFSIKHAEAGPVSEDLSSDHDVHMKLTWKLY